MSKQTGPSVTPGSEVWYATNGIGIGNLEGKLLTLLDASIVDPEQRKALKDILRQTIWGWAISDIDRVEIEDVKFMFRDEETGVQSGFRKNPGLKTKGE